MAKRVFVFFTTDDRHSMVSVDGVLLSDVAEVNISRKGCVVTNSKGEELFRDGNLTPSPEKVRASIADLFRREDERG